MHVTTSPEQSQAIALDIVNELHNKHILCLHGDLGVGKTTITQGIANYFNIKQYIKSPTFTLYRVYSIPHHKKFKQLCHVDAYRLTDEMNIQDIGLHEYLDDPNTFTIIEWPENIKTLISHYKNKVQNLYLAHGTTPETRKISKTPIN